MSIEEFVQLIRDNSDGTLTNVSTPVIMAMVVVVGLLVIASVVALVISVWLAIQYVVYNRRKNSLGKPGKEIARDVLDKNGLTRIAVKSSGSILFGNSYSHFFHKVRLRRLTWKKSSVSSLAMAYQKAQLAVLDKEGDKDMKTRIVMTPIIYFGPWALIPLLGVGMLLDVFIFTASAGICTIICAILGVLIYVAAFVMSIMVLKTEKKAQEAALVAMKSDGVSDSDIDDCKKLFRLYNIEYVNNMIIALLEMIYRVLQILAYFQNNSKTTVSND